MAIHTTGLFTVETGTAVIDVRLRIFLANLENVPHRAAVNVAKRRDNRLSQIVAQEITLPGGATRVVEVNGIAGEDVQVTVDLPDREYPPQSPVVPGVAVVSLFPPENETTLLHWISADDFVPVG